MLAEIGAISLISSNEIKRGTPTGLIRICASTRRGCEKIKILKRVRFFYLKILNLIQILFFVLWLLFVFLCITQAILQKVPRFMISTTYSI
jgi:hypothetical protein